MDELEKSLISSNARHVAVWELATVSSDQLSNEASRTWNGTADNPLHECITLNMNNCCSPSRTDDYLPKKHRCPVNGREYSEVSTKTIAHHVKEAWNWQQTAKRYFFCSDPSCTVVYFGDDGSTILKLQLRTRLGVKEDSDDALLCYCFGISKEDFRRNPSTRNFVIAQTKAGLCSCDTCNPSGRCCLKDFSKPA